MTTYIIRVKIASGETLAGRYIEGPSTPAQVKSLGYRFGQDRAKAWPFPSIAQAANKARIVERHMSMPPGWMEVLPAHDHGQAVENSMLANHPNAI